ncbi:hypothetical protein GCM10027168_54850 [Streptomyces capparidis]
MAMEAGPRDRPHEDGDGLSFGGTYPYGPDPGDPYGPLPGVPGPDGLFLAGPPGDRVPDQPLPGDALVGDALVGDAAGGPDGNELRPRRKMRIWEAVPIGGISVIGSLMFAFPLAFGDGGAVVAMLGLLLCACCAGWALTVARRVGYVWPGLPPRGSGGRPDWRWVAAYTALSLLVGVLTIWRVARLR